MRKLFSSSGDCHRRGGGPSTVSSRGRSAAPVSCLTGPLAERGEAGPGPHSPGQVHRSSEGHQRARGSLSPRTAVILWLLRGHTPSPPIILSWTHSLMEPSPPWALLECQPHAAVDGQGVGAGAWSRLWGSGWLLITHAPAFSAPLQPSRGPATMPVCGPCRKPSELVRAGDWGALDLRADLWVNCAGRRHVL